MTALFEPAGDRPRWEMLYDIFAVTEYGEVVSYTTLMEAADTDLKSVQHAVTAKVVPALVDVKRTLRAVKNEGYRVVMPDEHGRVAQLHHRKARRSMVRGKTAIDAVDYNLIDDPEVRKALRMQGAELARQASFLESIDARQARVEKRIAEYNARLVSGQPAADPAVLADLQRRLAALEGQQSSD
jgi:hypothetical protein